MDQEKRDREQHDAIDIRVERQLLSSALARLSLLDETESLKGAKQCLAAVIGWLERELNTDKPQ
jgi:hypothetical protein